MASLSDINKARKRNKRKRGRVEDSAIASVEGEKKLENELERFKREIGKTPKSNNIFNGLIFAVSTCNKTRTSSSTIGSKKSSSDGGNVEGHDDQSDVESSCTSYKDIMKLCKSGGAIVTGQVHKRVHALICTRSSFYAAPVSSVDDDDDHPAIPSIATQRVRKALKFSLDIVDASWLTDSLKQGRRLPHKKEGDGTSSSSSSSYLLNDVAKEAVENMKNSKHDNSASARENRSHNCEEQATTKKLDEADAQFDDANALAGWSEPVELDCCCVCHENGDDQCPWCVECNINLAKKRKMS